MDFMCYMVLLDWGKPELAPHTVPKRPGQSWIYQRKNFPPRNYRLSIVAPPPQLVHRLNKQPMHLLLIRLLLLLTLVSDNKANAL